MAAKSEWRPGPTVCRCCLTEGCYKDISTEYFWMGKREVYAEMLKDTLEVTIAYSKAGGPNSNSRLICESCISRLRDATEFKRQVVECERMFMQHLDPGSSSAAIEAETEPVGKIKVEGVKLEKSNSDDDFDNRHAFGDDDDDDDDDLDNQPLTKLASKMPTKESVDLLDLLDNSKTAEKRKSSTKVKPPPPKKAKSKVEQVKVKPSGSKLTPKPEKKKKGSDKDEPTPRIVPLFQVSYDRSLSKPLGTVDFGKLRKMRQSKMEAKPYSFTPSRSPSPLPISNPETDGPLEPPTPITIKPKEVQKTADIKQNVLTIFEFSTVYPFVYGNNKFKCFICSQPFLETSVLRQHMKEHHTFASLKRLVNNRRENILKVDVSEMECKICATKPNSLAELKYHLKDHDKLIDPDLKDNIIPFKIDSGESYQCVICDQVFIKVRILVIHMSVHFNNYSCEICGSGFMTLRLLKKHLEVHETGHYPCDKCNKVFTTPYKRTLHIRGVHMKQYPRRCPMCPERFNSNYKRTIHLQDVHNQSTRVHKCETCGRAFNLKYHLICHIRSVHLQERNQQCDVCHVRFCNKETLKRHMVIHTGEKNHKCDVCGMAFLRRKNLKDHLRLHDIGS
ncbi:zinc finger protein 366 isoform X5 [Amyelois transitella]|uniref:zinc finger protein 366 isoform X5 n=1 Tax=Amyelois transitella TaxID=680683 RepID=UPI00298FFCB4|nr:zinc finger protein 366 isoform X5 [Amyelois transitella]